MSSSTSCADDRSRVCVGSGEGVGWFAGWRRLYRRAVEFCPDGSAPHTGPRLKGALQRHAAKTTSRTKQKATKKGATTADGNRLPLPGGRGRLVGGAVDRCAQLGATTPAEPLVLGSRWTSRSAAHVHGRVTKN